MPSFRYNPSIDAIEGFSISGASQSQPSIKNPADHLFVIYLRGATSAWKQPIGCSTLKNSPSPAELKYILNDVICRAHENGKFINELMGKGGIVERNFGRAALLVLLPAVPYFLSKLGSYIFVFLD